MALARQRIGRASRLSPGLVLPNACPRSEPEVETRLQLRGLPREAADDLILLALDSFCMKSDSHRQILGTPTKTGLKKGDVQVTHCAWVGQAASVTSARAPVLFYHPDTHTATYVLGRHSGAHRALPVTFAERVSPPLNTTQTQSQPDHSRPSFCRPGLCQSYLGELLSWLDWLRPVSPHLWTWGGIDSTQTRSQLKQFHTKLRKA